MAFVCPSALLGGARLPPLHAHFEKAAFVAAAGTWRSRCLETCTATPSTCLSGTAASSGDIRRSSKKRQGCVDMSRRLRDTLDIPNKNE